MSRNRQNYCHAPDFSGIVMKEYIGIKMIAHCCISHFTFPFYPSTTAIVTIDKSFSGSAGFLAQR